jgi:hypothetical protein
MIAMTPAIIKAFCRASRDMHFVTASEGVCRDLPNLRLYTYRGHHHAGVPLMADSEIATIEMREFLAKMPVLEARFAKYEAALKAIAKEGDNDTGTAPAIFLTAVGHLNCRMLAKAALEPSPIYI